MFRSSIRKPHIPQPSEEAAGLWLPRMRQLVATTITHPGHSGSSSDSFNTAYPKTRIPQLDSLTSQSCVRAL